MVEKPDLCSRRLPPRVPFLTDGNDSFSLIPCLADFDDHAIGRSKYASHWILLEFVILNENITCKSLMSPRVGFTGKQAQPRVNMKSHSSAYYLKTVEIKMSEEKKIHIDLIEERTILRKSALLPLWFRCHPETGSTSISKANAGKI